MKLQISYILHLFVAVCISAPVNIRRGVGSELLSGTGYQRAAPLVENLAKSPLSIEERAQKPLSNFLGYHGTQSVCTVGEDIQPTLTLVLPPDQRR